VCLLGVAPTLELNLLENLTRSLEFKVFKRESLKRRSFTEVSSNASGYLHWP
jgi:hypothetical protein